MHLKSGVQRSPWSVFRKPQLFHTFSVILILSNYRKCMGISRFSKNWPRTSLHPRFKVWLLETRIQSYSFQRETIKYMSYMNSRRMSWLWIPRQIFEFPEILPWLPMMQLWPEIPLLPRVAESETFHAQYNSVSIFGFLFWGHDNVSKSHSHLFHGSVP